MPEFQSAGLTIHYEVAGEGPPIVLVHGFASSIRGNWKFADWFDALTGAGRRVVALDCRGHGRSEKPHDPEAYDQDAMADDVIRLMDHVGLERADLMGYSMGGMISTNLLLRYPHRFRSVVLAGIGNGVVGQGRTRNPEAIARALTADDPSTIEDRTARAFREFADQSKNDRLALAACMRRPRQPVDVEALGRVTLPVMVVVGEKDDLAWPADRLAGAIPGAELVGIPGKDHLGAVSDPLYKEAVLRFLAKQDAS